MRGRNMSALRFIVESVVFAVVFVGFTYGFFLLCVWFKP